jgi:hypothetical protein
MEEPEMPIYRILRLGNDHMNTLLKKRHTT